MAQAQVIRCRRCGTAYHLPARTALPACPRCGASPRPLVTLARHNAVAALLAVAGLAVLIAAFCLPFMQMSAMGRVTVVSLLGGIRQLFDQGHVFLAIVIFLFSVVFPIAKLALILAATSRLTAMSARWRQKLHRFAVFTGKYSLLDVLVLAILVVLVKFEGIAVVQVRVGTILFCIAVLLSLAAGVCVNLERPPRPDADREEPAR